MPDRKPTGRLTFTDGRGKPQSRPINYVLDVRDFVGLAGYVWVVMAANRHLSIADLQRLLCCDGVERSTSWIQRRRWMFRSENEGDSSHPDGKDARAVAIMRENRTLSLRQLSRLLAERGIRRGKDWVRQHRRD